MTPVVAENDMRSRALSAPPSLARRCALFLDFDGTLVPIAPRPQDVQVPDWVVPTLGRLQTHLDGALAIVSGRPLATLDGLLRPLRLPAAGVHGVERRLTNHRVRVHAAALPEAARRTAQALAAQHPGVLVEFKPGGLAVHYRAVPEAAAACDAALAQALDGADGWELMHGHCVSEVKQRRVSKAAVVRAFIAESVFAGRVPVFVGDDSTDETGIAVVQSQGGYGVKVGSGSSEAHHRLADPEAVGRWLRVSLDEADAAAAR
jgi:trehalose 6-phosphate phosphatase